MVHMTWCVGHPGQIATLNGYHRARRWFAVGRGYPYSVPWAWAGR